MDFTFPNGNAFIQRVSFTRIFIVLIDSVGTQRFRAQTHLE